MPKSFDKIIKRTKCSRVAVELHFVITVSVFEEKAPFINVSVI